MNDFSNANAQANEDARMSMSLGTKNQEDLVSAKLPYNLDQAVEAVWNEISTVQRTIGMIRAVNDEVFGINEAMMKKFHPDNQGSMGEGGDNSGTLGQLKSALERLASVNDELRCEVRRYENILPQRLAVSTDVSGLKFNAQVV